MRYEPHELEQNYSTIPSTSIGPRLKRVSAWLNKKDPFTAGVCFIRMPQRIPDDQQLTTITNHNQQYNTV